MNKHQKYKIIVEYYMTWQDLEAGTPYKVADSGFSKDLTLMEANILKSRMPNTDILRINKIVPVFNSLEQ